MISGVCRRIWHIGLALFKVSGREEIVCDLAGISPGPGWSLSQQQKHQNTAGLV